MPYKNRIKTLEESHRLVDNQLFQLEKSGSNDSDKIQKLRETKDKYLTDLRIMRRAQWDHDHETIDYEDDR
jgi:flagellar biosynthesis/type III secretory pathway chaperone